MGFLRIGCYLLIGLLTAVSAAHQNVSSPPPPSSIGSGAFSALKRVYGLCENSSDIIRCFKIQALKLVSRALKVHDITLVDGLSVIKKTGLSESRSFSDDSMPKDRDLQSLPVSKIDNLLYEKSGDLFQSHEIEVNIPKLMAYGQKEVGRLLEEGKGKKDKKSKYLGHFMAAMALKAGILKMAYHSIAMIAGKALLIGKIALVISTIIGMKKLIAPEGHEKTTYEIVKHPHVQNSHSYSSSHSTEYEGGHEGGGGQYHRSISEDELQAQDRVYKAHKPRS